MTGRELYEALKAEGIVGPWEWPQLELEQQAPFERVAAKGASQPPFQSWQSYGSNICRMRVDGGWLYRRDDTPNMVFAPEAP